MQRKRCSTKLAQLFFSPSQNKFRIMESLIWLARMPILDRRRLLIDCISVRESGNRDLDSEKLFGDDPDDFRNASSSILQKMEQFVFKGGVRITLLAVRLTSKLY